MFLCSLMLNLSARSQSFDFDCDEDPKGKAAGRGDRSSLRTHAVNSVRLLQVGRLVAEHHRIERPSPATEVLPIEVFKKDLRRKGWFSQPTQNLGLHTQQGR
jgi:hypothetical protein